MTEIQDRRNIKFHISEGSDDPHGFSQGCTLFFQLTFPVCNPVRFAFQAGNNIQSLFNGQILFRDLFRSIQFLIEAADS